MNGPVFLIQMPRRRSLRRRIEWRIHPDDYEVHATYESAKRSAEYSRPHWHRIERYGNQLATAYRIDGEPLWRIVGLDIVES